MDYTPDYEKDKTPNEHDLFGDWARQSFLYDYYATKYKDACNLLLDKKEDSRLAKENYEYIKAKIDLDIRQNSQKYGLEKLTEKTIDSATTINKEVRSAQEKFNKTKRGEIEAQKIVNLLQVAEITIGTQKKVSLEELTKAFYSGFFGEPSINNNSFEKAVKTRLKERKK